MAVKALFLAALLAVAMCGPTVVSHGETGRLDIQLGSKRCTFGPSYWCDHIRKSAECQMTPWCIDNVWKNMDLPEDDDDVCTICKNMVKEARDQLNSNMTQEELKEVLEGSCNLLPIKIIAKECDALVDDFIPELVEVLSSQMNPQVVCQTAGLCNSKRVDKLIAKRTLKKSKPADTCAVCGEKMEALKQHTVAGGQQELLDSLLPVCRDLGSYSDACAADLAAHIDSIFQFVQTVDAQGVCLMGNACPGLYEQPPFALTSSGPAVDCDLCIHIVKHWRDILVANTTKEEFKEILDGICSKTKAWAPKCTQLVDEYYEIIYDYLVNQMRAHSICKAIGLCAKPGQVPLWVTVPADRAAVPLLQGVSDEPQSQPLVPLEKPAAVPLTKLTPSAKLHTVTLHRAPPRAYGDDGLAHENPLEESESSEEAEPLPQLPLSRLGLPDLSGLFQRNTELCDLCEFGLHELQQVLEDGPTDDEIARQVGRLCDLLPATLTVQCNRFVMEYGSFVIEMLAQEIDPNLVCPALRLCPQPGPSEAELQSLDGGQGSEEAEEVQGGGSSEEVAEGPGCALCEYAMNTLLEYLQDKKTEDEIREGLDRLCEMLPHTVSRECEEFVNTFMEEIIDMIVSDMTADEICITLRLCTGSTGVNDVQTNSIHAVHPMTPYGGMGLRFAGLTPVLAGLPVNSPRRPSEPEQVLPGGPWAPPAAPLPARIKRPVQVSSEEEEEEEEEGQSPVCVLCEFVLMQLKVRLNDQSTDEQIENEFKKVCSYMPRSLQADCRGFVDEYGVAFLDELKAEIADPDLACEKINLCSDEQPGEP